MASKQVTDRQKGADTVSIMGEPQAAATGEALAKACSTHLKKGEALPDFALGIRLLARLLDAQKRALVEADEAHERELGDDDEVRTARDEAAQTLSSSLVELREVLLGVYGGAAVDKVFTGPTPQDPVVLSRTAREVATKLEKVKLPAPRVRGAKLDVAETVANLEGQCEALERALKDVQREVREAQATLAAKSRALESYDELFAGVALSLSGLLRIAGKPDLAAKVKPSSRRPGTTASEGGDEGAPEAAPAGNTPG